MMAAWMMYTAGVGVLMGAGALAGERFCRLLRLPVRWVWIMGMAGTLVLSCVALVRLDAGAAPWAAKVEHAGAGVDRSGQASQSGTRDWFAALVAGVRERGTAASRRMYRAAAVGEGVERSLAAGWVVSSAGLLVLLCGTLLRLGHARRRWCDHRIGNVAVLVSLDTGPALVGLVRPRIVVPAWLLAEPVGRQQLVVQHEDEHRRAGDHVLLAVACAAVCAQPWNVALWWMLRRTRLAVEIDCDARVLRQGAGARSYGTLLLEIAARTRGLPFGAPALADSSTHLERRLIAMTENNRTPRRAAAAAAGLSAGLLVLAACAADLPTAAAIDDMHVAEAQMQAERAGLLLKREADDGPLFIVDGVIVTEDAARSLTPGEIRSIEVLKAAAAVRAHGESGAHGVVSIVTRSDGAGETSAARLDPLGVPLTETDRSALVERARNESVVRLRASRAGGAAAVSGDNPLIIVDGVVVPETFSVSSLAPAAVERIEVVKGEAARRLYDNPRAANGVILITTKPGGR